MYHHSDKLPKVFQEFLKDLWNNTMLTIKSTQVKPSIPARAGPDSVRVHLTPIGGEPPAKVRYRGDTPKDRVPTDT